MFASLLLLAASVSGGSAEPVYELDARGIVARLDVASSTFLTDASVGVIAPDWQGSLGDQRGLEPQAVQTTQQAGATVYSSVLESGDQRTRLRQVVRPLARGVRLEYELTPEVEIAVETVVFRATIPLLPHRGTTRFVAFSEEVTQGVFPPELPTPSYHFLPGQNWDWLALVAADGAALRIQAEGITLGLQDARKFGHASYELLGCAPVRGKLAAGQPLRLAVELTASTADEVARAQAAALATTLSGFPLSARAVLRAGSVAVDRAAVPVYERVELTADVAATFDNPFDPDDVALDARITLPDGRTVSVPGFFDVPCQLEPGVRERVRPAGPACWRFRFTPTLAGKYQAVVRVRDRSGQAECPPVSFAAIPSAQSGFVRVAPESPLYFQFDDGASYFPVGENVCWSGGPKPVADYAAWFGGLAGQGGNWARLWLATTEKGLEWTAPPTAKGGSGHYLGLGRYSIDNSWRLDQVVRLAEQNGIRLMFCIGTFGEIKQEDDYFNANLWVSNPYNSANGGPCATPQDFFTSPAARKLYQRRLRYILARWGYSPHVFAWEFWNEYEAPAGWVQEMAAYLKQHDPNRHLVSSTYGNEQVWKLPEVDFTMTHHYGDRGSITDFGSLIEQHSHAHRGYGKPYFIAEFGIDWRTSDSQYDPEGRGQGLHNGLWAGVMSGGAGTPMLWYWDHYVHPKNLYGVFRPVSNFVQSVDWARTRFTPLTDATLTMQDGSPEQFADFDFSIESAWGKTAGNRYVLHRDGRIEGGPIAGAVGSPHKEELFDRISFQLDMPADGKFTVRLGTVSSRARLQIRVDDRLQVDEPLATGPPGEGPWKTATHYPQWQIWQADYDRDYAVQVPAGQHSVTISNAEGDWLSLRGGRVTGYRSNRYPFVRLLGLRTDRLALIWLQDKHSTWKSVLDKISLQEMVDLRVALPGLPAGEYQIDWWNTYTGEVFQQTKANADREGLRLEVPRFTGDIAAVIRRLGEP